MSLYPVFFFLFDDTSPFLRHLPADGGCCTSEAKLKIRFGDLFNGSWACLDASAMVFFKLNLFIRLSALWFLVP